MPENTFETGIIVGMLPYISHVFRLCRFAEIAETIIGSDTINMIDLLFRPCARDVEPSETVQFISPTVDASLQVSAPVQRANDITCFHAIAGRDFPREYTRLGFVSQ